MKLSDFLKVKKLSFVGGRVSVQNSMTDGDIDFYELNTDRLMKIKDEVFDKLNPNYTEERFTYDILPYVCNVERDIDLDQFMKLMAAPSVEFTYFQENLIDIINKVLDLGDRIEVLNDKVGEMKSKKPELFVKEETLQDKIIRLTKEMENEIDVKKKMELIKVLAKLYEEVENEQ
jgi:hypothetical protein